MGCGSSKSANLVEIVSDPERVEDREENNKNDKHERDEQNEKNQLNDKQAGIIQSKKNSGSLSKNQQQNQQNISRKSISGNGSGEILQGNEDGKNRRFSALKRLSLGIMNFERKSLKESEWDKFSEVFKIYAHVDRSITSNPYIRFLVTLLLSPDQHRQFLLNNSIESIHSEAFQSQSQFVDRNVESIEDFFSRQNRHALFMEKQRGTNEYVGVSLHRWLLQQSNSDLRDLKIPLKFFQEISMWLEKKYLWSMDYRLFLTVEKNPLKSLLYFAQSNYAPLQICAVNLLLQISLQSMSSIVKRTSLFVQRIHQSIDIHFIAASWFSKKCNYPLGLKVVTIMPSEISFLLRSHRQFSPFSDGLSWLDDVALTIQSPQSLQSHEDPSHSFSNANIETELFDPINATQLKDLINRIDEVTRNHPFFVDIGTIQICSPGNSKKIASSPNNYNNINSINNVNNNMNQHTLAHKTNLQRRNSKSETLKSKSPLSGSGKQNKLHLFVNFEDNELRSSYDRFISSSSNITNTLDSPNSFNSSNLSNLSIKSFVSMQNSDEISFDSQIVKSGKDLLKKLIENDEIFSYIQERRIIHSFVNDLEFDMDYQPQQLHLNMNFLPAVTYSESDLWTQTRVFVYQGNVTAASQYYIDMGHSKLYTNITNEMWDEWEFQLKDFFNIQDMRRMQYEDHSQSNQDDQNTNIYKNSKEMNKDLNRDLNRNLNRNLNRETKGSSKVEEDIGLLEVNFIVDVIRLKDGSISILSILPFHSLMNTLLFNWNEDWYQLTKGQFILKHL